MTIELAAIVLALLGAYYLLRAFWPERSLRGIPEPKGLPVFGHLLQLGPSPALTYLQWSKDLDSEVIQIKLGTKRIVVINSYSAAMQLIYHNMAANCDRPQPHTFSNVVSTTGLTVGTTPYGPSYKRMRKAIGGFLCRSNINVKQKYLDKESDTTMNQLTVGKDIRPHNWFKSYPFNVATSLTYGFRVNRMAKINYILSVEQHITRFRAHFATNMADYFPIMRWFVSEPREAKLCRKKREDYLNEFMNRAVEKRDPECLISLARHNCFQLNDRELKSICMTMSSAGLDSIPGILALFVGHMSTNEGQAMQARAFEELVEAFPHDAYNQAVQGKELPYVTALVTELLRFSGMPLGLPRRTVKPIEYIDERNKNVTIPENTTLVLNIFAANFDHAHYTDALRFNPDRFLSEKVSPGPQHFSFGAGSRICAGQSLAKREIYVAVVRLIIRFRILPSKDASQRFSAHPFDIYRRQSALMFDLPNFRVRFEPRN